jgi:hypothetical protein
LPVPPDVAGPGEAADIRLDFIGRSPVITVDFATPVSLRAIVVIVGFVTVSVPVERA